MKIKEAIKNLKVEKNLKNYSSKNICRSFYGAVVGNMGSIQCEIVPCSSFYFSRSMGSLQS